MKRRGPDGAAGFLLELQRRFKILDLRYGTGVAAYNTEGETP
jgi:hypothetical protein